MMPSWALLIDLAALLSADAHLRAPEARISPGDLRRLCLHVAMRHAVLDDYLIAERHLREQVVRAARGACAGDAQAGTYDVACLHGVVRRLARDAPRWAR